MLGSTLCGARQIGESERGQCTSTDFEGDKSFSVMVENSIWGRAGQLGAGVYCATGMRYLHASSSLRVVLRSIFMTAIQL
jgi:hypothetical protein